MLLSPSKSALDADYWTSATLQVVRFLKQAVPFGQQAQLASHFVQDVLIGFWLSPACQSRPGAAAEEAAEVRSGEGEKKKAAAKGGGTDFWKFDFTGEDMKLKTLPFRYFLPPDADSKLGAHFLDARQKDSAGGWVLRLVIRNTCALVFPLTFSSLVWLGLNFKLYSCPPLVCRRREPNPEKHGRGEVAHKALHRPGRHRVLRL